MQSTIARSGLWLGGLFLWLVNKYKMQPNERATRKQLIDKALEEGRLVIWK
jgi:hypothetical protein